MGILSTGAAARLADVPKPLLLSKLEDCGVGTFEMSEDEFQYYLNAADVAVLPFREVMTSGSAIQALGFGLPVVLPQRGCMGDLVDASMGVLYNPDRGGALAEAMRRVREIDLGAAGRAARTQEYRLDWDEIGDRVAVLYRGE